MVIFLFSFRRPQQLKRKIISHGLESQIVPEHTPITYQQTEDRNKIRKRRRKET